MPKKRDNCGEKDSLRLPWRPATGLCVELSRWRTELPFRRATDSAEDPTAARP